MHVLVALVVFSRFGDRQGVHHALSPTYRRAYYINLEKRTDRLEQVRRTLDPLFPGAVRISAAQAVPSNPNAVHPDVAPFEEACRLSHIKALHRAIDDSVDVAYIFEDDVQWYHDRAPSMRAPARLETDARWDVVLLGGTYCNYRLPVRGLSRANNCQTTHAYAVRKAYLLVLLQYWQRTAGPIDMTWKILQARDRWYIVNPMIAVQRKGYSDIQSKNVDYGVHFHYSKWWWPF